MPSTNWPWGEMYKTGAKCTSVARLGGACCHIGINRETGQVQWGRGEGGGGRGEWGGEGRGFVNLWFRCDITQ